ncbi:hypothetical protein ACFJIX_03970 [Roseateles sp. UC29_93]|uniref:hypothetical protein n=1 Tax=Roseateles sp. UC29_93 TaxID=3350177 RepID=UPI00366B2E1F
MRVLPHDHDQAPGLVRAQWLRARAQPGAARHQTARQRQHARAEQIRLVEQIGRGLQGRQRGAQRQRREPGQHQGGGRRVAGVTHERAGA